MSDNWGQNPPPAEPPSPPAQPAPPAPAVQPPAYAPPPAPAPGQYQPAPQAYAPQYVQPQSRGGEGQAIAALVIGILGVFTWCLPILGVPLAIVGIVLGVMGMKSSKRTLAIIGLVLCVLSLLGGIVNGVLGAVLAVSDPTFLESL